MNGFETARYWNPLLMQKDLTPQEKELRDRFVTEYLVDFDPYNAAIRTGFLQGIAHEYAKHFMLEPYVQQEIARRQREVDDPKSTLKRRKIETELALIREAHHRGPGSSHSARVAALSKLCNIYDMDGASKIKAEVTHKGGVMLVPAIASVEEWERQAASEQDRLMSVARH